MERKNKNVKSKGNGEGTIYFSETLQKWVAQYVEPNGKRKTITQRKIICFRGFCQKNK